MKQKSLRNIRIILSCLILALITFIFIDFQNNTPSALRDVLLLNQFVPSLFRFVTTLSVIGLGFLLITILTFAFGRVYCSSLCPLGTLQDFFIFIKRKLSRKKPKFLYAKPRNILRYSILAFCLGSLFFTPFVVYMLDPYSNFGRIAFAFFKPVYVSLNNLGAGILNKYDNFLLFKYNLASVRFEVYIYSILILGALLALSFRKGRLFCNTICPVGSLLGLMAKKSLFKISIDSKSCTHCGKCSMACKSGCINLKKNEIDFSRCVACFNCIKSCQEDSIQYRFSPVRSKSDTQKISNERRDVILKAFALIVGSSFISRFLMATDKIVPKNLNKVLIKKKTGAISPPGSLNTHRFNELCTACHLCVSACPTQVLRPSVMEYGLKGFMQPHMDFLANFCNHECVICSNVCPTGAILPLLVEKKKVLQLGQVSFVKDNCIVSLDETDCGACSEHCPTKAVYMVNYKNNLTIPEINQKICIGCGACEYVCPAKPNKAIYVDGNAIHQVAEKPKEEKIEVKQTEEFPF